MNLFIYNKNIAAIFLGVVLLSILITLSPAITLHYVDIDIVFFSILMSHFIMVTLLYFLCLRKITGCIIRVKSDSATVKLTSLLFLVIVFIQLAVYCYRDSFFHYEPSHINWMVVIVLTLVVPYYEEIVYRVCAFGFLSTIYKKNLIIPCVLTSLFFCLMHFQYYNILDQIVLFVVSVLLLMVRIKSQSPLYPMLMHSGMNAFIILLNIKITL